MTDVDEATEDVGAGGEDAIDEPVSTGDDLLDGLLDGVESARWESSHGQDVIIVDPTDLLELANAAKDAGFEMCADVTAVDWYKHRVPRFEVVIALVSLRHLRRLRLRVPVERENPVVPSMVPVWPGANFAEREVYDMFGIRFDGHPDLSRILMPDDWDGHPLQKDYGVGAVPVQFKGANKVT